MHEEAAGAAAHECGRAGRPLRSTHRVLKRLEGDGAVREGQPLEGGPTPIAFEAAAGGRQQTRECRRADASKGTLAGCSQTCTTAQQQLHAHAGRQTLSIGSRHCTPGSASQTGRHAHVRTRRAPRATLWPSGRPCPSGHASCPWLQPACCLRGSKAAAGSAGGGAAASGGGSAVATGRPRLVRYKWLLRVILELDERARAARTTLQRSRGVRLSERKQGPAALDISS